MPKVPIPHTWDHQSRWLTTCYNLSAEGYCSADSYNQEQEGLHPFLFLTPALGCKNSVLHSKTALQRINIPNCMHSEWEQLVLFLRNWHRRERNQYAGFLWCNNPLVQELYCSVRVPYGHWLNYVLEWALPPNTPVLQRMTNKKHQGFSKYSLPHLPETLQAPCNLRMKSARCSSHS